VDVLVTEIVLDQPRIVSAVGQVIAAGMTQHVRVDRQLVQAGHCGTLLNQHTDRES